MENMNNAAAIINEWNSLTTQTQINFITACTFKIIKAQPTGTRYEINEVVNEAWLRITDSMSADRLTAINERRAAQGKAPTTLAGIVYNAARASIAAMTASKDNTEAAAILRTDLQRFIASRDSTDQQIIYGLMKKQTERELVAVVGISAPAVHKRIAKIRATLAEII